MKGLDYTYNAIHDIGIWPMCSLTLRNISIDFLLLVWSDTVYVMSFIFTTLINLYHSYQFWCLLSYSLVILLGHKSAQYSVSKFLSDQFLNLLQLLKAWTVHAHDGFMGLAYIWEKYTFPDNAKHFSYFSELMKVRSFRLGLVITSTEL